MLCMRFISTDFPVTSHSVSLKSIKPTIDLTLQIPHYQFSRELCLLTSYEPGDRNLTASHG